MSLGLPVDRLSIPELRVDGLQKYGETVTIRCSTYDDDAKLKIRRNGVVFAESPFEGTPAELRSVDVAG